MNSIESMKWDLEFTEFLSNMFILGIIFVNNSMF